MLLTEYNARYQRKLDRRDAKAEGRTEGRTEERERMNRLITLLLEQNRTEDLARAAADPEYQEQLFKELGL